MRLLSVNVGMPRDVQWRGETVHTGIWKEPVSGPRMVSDVNVDGDGQGDLGGHGGVNRAVFVYQIEAYRYWQTHLGRDGFVYGQFGENFTVEGMEDDQVCIGDRYGIGEAIFEVSQPRVTCFRLGMRMDDPKMPSLVVAHHRPGFYLRTLQPGHVQAGDEIRKLESGPEKMTVAEIDALLYLPNRSRIDLQRALRIPALSEGWQGSFRDLLERDAVAAQQPALAWAGLKKLRVTAIEPESTTIVSIHLRPDGDTHVASPLPGQFLSIRVEPEESKGAVIRSYSLSGSPDAGEYRISVKREPNGAASGYLHTQLRVGDQIEAGAPRGSFILQPGNRPVVLISGGVGATPLLAMLHALATQKSRREVWWVHSAHDGAEEPFAEEVSLLLRGLQHSHRLICLSTPRDDDRPEIDFDVSGRLNCDVMHSHGVPVDADFYACGPKGFMHDISAGLVARGVRADRIRTETFGPGESLTPGVISTKDKPSPHAPAGQPGDGPTVSFARSDLSVAWDDSYGSLLELAEACDVPVRWVCRTGVCQTCQTGVIDGSVDYDPDPLDSPAEGTALICCSRPTDELVLDL